MVDYNPTTAASGQVFPFVDLPTTTTPVTAAWLNHVHAVLGDIAADNARLEVVEQGALRVLVHNGTAYPSRPSVPAGLVRYVGPTQPTTWLSNDEWVNNS